MRSDQYDVIVLGLGAMGTATCLALAKKGARVLGTEQFQIGHNLGSSHGETRIIRRAYFEHADYIPLLNRSYSLWKEIESKASETLFTQNGLITYADPKTSVVYQGTRSSAQKHNIPIQMWTTAEAQAKFPQFKAAPHHEALFEPDAGFLYAEKCVRQMAAQATQAGAHLLENHKVLSYVPTAGGVSVKTQKNIFQAGKLIITGGGWAKQLLQDLRIPISLRRMILYWYDATDAYSIDHQTPCFAFHTEKDFYYGFPMIDQKTVKVAAHFAHEPISDPKEKATPAPNVQHRSDLENWIRSSLPGVSTTLKRFESCIYTMTPDEHFILDQHPAHPQICFGAGFSGHGFKFASVIGEILSELSLEGKTQHPIDFLRLRQFIHGNAGAH